MTSNDGVNSPGPVAYSFQARAHRAPSRNVPSALLISVSLTVQPCGQNWPTVAGNDRRATLRHKPSKLTTIHDTAAARGIGYCGCG